MANQETLKTEVIVIGAGAVGLALAHRLSARNRVVVIEKNVKFGQETSSRNSEVVHSGIYYPANSRKTEWCIRGRELLYSFCEQFKVPFLKCGKYVVATQSSDSDYLEQLKNHCDSLGIPNSYVSQTELKNREPMVNAREGLFFSESGIVDSHSMMSRLEQLSLHQNTVFAYGHRLSKIQKNSIGWEVTLQTSEGLEKIQSEIVINAAGLGAAQISNETLHLNRYEHRFCRGRYLNLSSKFLNAFKSLVYPTPLKDGLGVHVTRDLAGMVRLGPDVDWLTQSNYEKVDALYDCDWESLKPEFLIAAQRYLPSLSLGDLSPGLIGLRPKLFVDQIPNLDFLMENHEGFIHLLGIESPGLTSAMAIAEAVENLL